MWHPMARKACTCMSVCGMAMLLLKITIADTVDGEKDNATNGHNVHPRDEWITGVTPTVDAVDGSCHEDAECAKLCPKHSAIQH